MTELEIFTEQQEQETPDLKIPKDGMLWEYIKKACTGGPTAKLIFIAITSRVEGKIKSEGLPYGQGKSLLAGILAAYILKAFDGLLGINPYESVKNNMGYTWEHHIKAVKEANERRKLVYVMDDLQRIAGKSKSRDSYVQSWAEYFTTARPSFGVVIVTCPSVGELAKCFRELINFEIKIPKAGRYEVQFYKDYSNYGKPLEPLKSMKYKGEGIIPRAPQWFVDWYIKWRKEYSFDSFLDRLETKNKDAKEKIVPVDEQYKRAKEQGIFTGTREQFRELSRKQNPIQ